MTTERTAIGDQYVIPGAERDAGASLARNLAAAPLRPKATQAPCDIGLFDSARRDQLAATFTV